MNSNALLTKGYAGEQHRTPTHVERVGETLIVHYEDAAAPADFQSKIVKGNNMKMDTTVNVTSNDHKGPLNGLEGITPRDVDAMNAALVMANTLGGVRNEVAELRNPVITVPVDIHNELTKEQAAEAQSIVAEKLLAANGWSILSKLAMIIVELIQTTQLYVLPVFASIEEIKPQLGEQGEAFVERFDILRSDLADISELVVALSRRHAGRDGEVAAEDMDLVSELTSGYSNIQTQMETKVGPEMMDQLAILEAAGISAEYLFEQFTATQGQPE